ncbi:Hemolysin, contains CBS domains [Deinococcus reticulitermitis]|uniref:Hemolysin, contains CBS domains n=1 Tax=Deinococcus reticulitermitis TaxID=856736 RepID=A0A1H6X1H8_9DEIO|nr:hemolysin family protein [Deinococcus reticulitermitis]SEJ21996.1 Hemolysin, contains CBS domains [Deinococcus reticulitermitis]
MNDLLGLLALFFLVLLNGFFVAAEFSLVSVRRTRIDQLADEGNTTAQATRGALQNLDLYIAATQLGITMASLSIGFVAEPAIEHLLEPLLHDTALLESQKKAIAVGVAFASSTILHIVFGELAPKSWALQQSERVALLVTRPLLAFTLVFKWAIRGLNALGNGVVRAFGLRGVAGHHTAYSEEEIRMIVSASSQEGVLEDSEKELVYNVFDLSDTTVREVMRPRVDMITVDSALPLRRLIELHTEHGYSRVPVYENSADNIVGIAHMGDVLHHLGELDHLTIAEVMRPVFFVPEGMKIKDLLAKMRDKKSHMSIVVDEFGGTTGLVTLEDALEEIVGEIYDETDDEEEQPVIVIAEGIYLMDAGLTVHEVEERLGTDLEEGEAEYDTLAGFVTTHFGDIPGVGQSFVYRGWAFTVEEADQRRVTQVRVERSADLDPFDLPVELPRE